MKSVRNGFCFVVGMGSKKREESKKRNEWRGGEYRGVASEERDKGEREERSSAAAAHDKAERWGSDERGKRGMRCSVQRDGASGGGWSVKGNQARENSSLCVLDESCFVE